jgi:hypothetical protein
MPDSPLATFFALLLVSALWGVTNPFLGRATAADGTAPPPRARKRGGGAAAPPSPPPRQLLPSFLSRLSFWALYGANQAGSLLYHALLGRSELTLVGPLANALTVVFTGLTAAFALGERAALQPRALAGAALVCAGVALCVSAKMQA